MSKSISDSDWLDEIDFMITVKSQDVPLQDYKITDMRIRLEEHAKETILAEIDKAIGVDDSEKDDSKWGTIYGDYARNQLRAELRAKLGIEK